MQVGRHFKVWQLGLIHFVLIMALILPHFELNAQSNTHWEEPIVLFNVGETARVFNPLVIEDPMGEIKILWETTAITEAEESEWPGGVYCTTGDGISWSPPVDVISAPEGGRTFWLRHALDRFGRLHLVYVGPNGQLFHSRAPSAEACDARSWQTALVPTPDLVLYGSIAIDGQGIIHIAYAGRGKGVYYVRSADEGSSWSESVAVSSVMPDRGTAFPELAIGEDGRVHVVWEEDQLPDGVPGLGLFYAFSQDQGQSWSTPLLFSQNREGYTQPTIAILEDGTIHLLWNGRIGTRGRYHQWSSDQSFSWSPMSEFIPKDMGGGQTGPPAHALDSLGRLHVVSGTDDTTYSAWEEKGWLNPQDIAPFDMYGNMEDQNIAVVKGKDLYVVTNADLQRIVLIRGITDAPEAARTFDPLPRTMGPSDSPDSQATLPPPTESTFQPTNLDTPKPADNAFFPIVLGSGLAFLVVFVVVVAHRRQRRS